MYAFAWMHVVMYLCVCVCFVVCLCVLWCVYVLWCVCVCRGVGWGGWGGGGLTGWLCACLWMWCTNLPACMSAWFLITNRSCVFYVTLIYTRNLKHCVGLFSSLGRLQMRKSLPCTGELCLFLTARVSAWMKCFLARLYDTCDAQVRHSVLQASA